MADPKIRYDIGATVSGDAEIAKLATELEKLDSALDPALAERARQAAARLRELGEQGAAIDRFVEIKAASTTAAAGLEQAQQAAQAFARSIATGQEPTRAQAGQLEKLRDAVRSAKTELERQTAELATSRAALTALGVPTEGLAQRQVALRQAVAATSTELRQIGTAASATQGLASIAAQTDAAAAGLTDVQTAVAAMSAKLAASEAPTAAEVAALQRLAAQVDASRAALERQSASLSEQRAALVAAGVPTDALEVKQTRLAAQLAATSSSLQQLSSRGASLQSFAALVTQTEAARDALFLADRALSDYRTGLGNAAAPTQTQARRLGELALAANQAQQAFQGASQAQATSAAQLRSTGVDVDRLVAAQRQLAAQGSAVAQSQQQAAAAAAVTGRAFQTAAQQQTQAATQVKGGLEGIGGQLRNIQTLAAAALGGQLLSGTVGDVLKTADAYNNLGARIKLVTGEGDAFARSFKGVFDVATATGATLESTGTLFARIAQAGKAIGVSTQDALALTQAVNQAVQISGASAASSDAALTQLIQGLQSGVLRGEEFNSVMEQAPRLAEALAAGLGVTTGELRKLAEAGQLTSATVISALQGQSAVLAKEFETLPPTVGRALQNLSTEWTRYVGEVDKANGISSAAAGAIAALASHLDTVAASLYAVGKAVLAYQALKLASSFVTAGQSAAAAAVQIATVGPALATAGTNAAAASVQVGRFSGLLAGLKAFSVVGLLTNLPAIGTALGEGIAKLAGYRDRSAEVEIADKAAAEAARVNAQQKAALAQQMQIAADKALGLTGRSKELVAEFDGLRLKGDSTTEALGKLGKSFNLTELKGITEAGAALDALAVKGKISGTQISDALGAALSGADLVAFATQARAAFDDSEQGARRLSQALAAVDSEALRRAGTSAQELATGFSAAANAAINNVDALVGSLQGLGIKGAEAGKALAGSLDKAVDAANTERAVGAVIARLQDLGEQGLLSGDQLAAGLDKARTKLDSLTPGVQGLNEALSTFGLKSQDELQRTADKYQSAWDQIRTSTQVSLADQVKAFEQYKTAAIAANGGIVPSALALQEEMLRSRSAAQGLATSFDAVGDRGVRNLQRVAEQANQTAGAIDGLSERNRQLTAESAKSDADRKAINATASDNTAFFTLFNKQQAGTLTADDLAQAQFVERITRENTIAGVESGAFGLQGLAAASADSQRAKAILDYVQALADAKTSGRPAPAPRQRVTTDSTGRATFAPAVAPAAVPAAAPVAGAVYTVRIELGGSTRSINTASNNDAQMLQAFIRELAAAKSVAQ